MSGSDPQTTDGDADWLDGLGSYFHDKPATGDRLRAISGRLRAQAAEIERLRAALEDANDAAEANAAWGGRMKQERDALRKDITDEGQ